MRLMAVIAALWLLSCGETPGDYPGRIITVGGAEAWAPHPLMVWPLGDVPRLEDAVEYWPCVELCDDDTCANTATTRATATIGYVPSGWGEDRWGVAMVRIDDETGEVLYCDIVVSSDIAYDHDTVEDVLVHEIGHCLGLADDPGVESIMASPPGWILRSEDADVCREEVMP